MLTDEEIALLLGAARFLLRNSKFTHYTDAAYEEQDKLIAGLEKAEKRRLDHKTTF